MTQVRFLLFDVDETLYPRTSPLWPLLRERILRYMVERLSMTRAQAEALRAKYIGQYGTTTRGLHLHHGIDMPDYLAYVHDVPTRSVLRSDAELDASLSRISIEKCIFTNATRQHAQNVVDGLGIAQHFTRIFSLEDFDYVSKPEERPYEVVLSALSVAGDACVLVEDSLANLLAGKRFGMTTVLVDGRLQAPLPYVDHIIGRIHDIGDVVQRIATS